jgi:hypothetical protein
MIVEVICIDNSFVIGSNWFMINSIPKLTIGKTYKAFSNTHAYDGGVSEVYLSMKDDAGLKFDLKKNRFMAIDEYREKQLNILL